MPRHGSRQLGGSRKIDEFELALRLCLQRNQLGETADLVFLNRRSITAYQPSLTRLYLMSAKHGV